MKKEKNDTSKNSRKEPKEPITAYFASCTCGWSVSRPDPLDAMSAAGGHRILHKRCAELLRSNR